MKEHTKEELEQLSTRELLSVLDDVRANHDSDRAYHITLGQRVRMYEDRMHDLKTILATRENIPNKQEAKAIRQEKAKAKKNR